MSQPNYTVLLACLALLNAIPLSAHGQTAPPPANVQAPPAAAQPPQYPAPAAAQPQTAAPPAAPTPVPAQPPQQIFVPPGYMLVPMGGPSVADQESRRAQAIQREQEMMNAYREGDPVPAGYRVIQEPRRGLVIAGSIVLGISYGLSVVGAVGADFDDKSGTLMVPVLGPWLMLALGGAKDRSCERIDGMVTISSSNYCGDRSGLRAMLTLDGLTQAAGAIMLTTGFALPRTRLVRNNFEVSLTPMPLARDGYGIGAIGRF